ncbi:hypothetical protein K458DRAFT_151480 [Lentithecium fluviatile CBS 122367]|uniref:Uncharacterized protein n=1 Tax=Lentithecium fluviatile CBS 122367 TaxID=1168545 RepID=A0A6G1JEQ6_9PLEO|nr:hypothetical protein K458DRAFT_151480 [Lentithecium fluviatile CBS 122367]
MNARKRSTAGSRGNSPPGKRVRSGEYDRYAVPGSPTRPFSPPPSRHNSITGFDVPIPTGPAPKTRDGRRIDHYRPNSDKEPRREPLDRRLSNGIRGPHDAGISPMLHTHSPLSVLHDDTGTPGSGGSTPQHVAPPAPSMLAATPSTGNVPRFSFQALAGAVTIAKAEIHSSRLNEHEKAEGSLSGTLSSLRLIKAKKQAQASLELENCRQRVGSFMSPSPRPANSEKTGTDAPSNEQRVSPSKTDAEVKVLQIEMDMMKKERKALLDRLNKLEGLDSLRQDLQSLSNQLKPFEEVPQQLSRLGVLSDSVEELKQWRESQPKPLTLEEVQSSITERTESALQTIKMDFTTQINRQMPKSNPPSLSQDVRLLLQFKKGIEEENWPGQIQAAKFRIEKVTSNEVGTRDKAEKLGTDIEKHVKLLKEQIIQVEKNFDDKIDQALDSHASDLKAVSGPLQDERQRTGKTVLDRIQALEKSHDAFQGRQDRLSNDFIKSKRDLDGRLTNLSANASNATMTKELNDRIDTVNKTLKDRIDTVNTTINATAMEELQDQIDRVNKTLNGRIDTVATTLNAASPKELHDRIGTASKALDNRINTATKALDDRITTATETFDNGIDAVTTKFNDRIDTVTTTLNDRINSVDTTFNNRIDKVSTTMDKTISTKFQEFRGTIDDREKQWAATSSGLEGRMTKAEQLLPSIDEAQLRIDQNAAYDQRLIGMESRLENVARQIAVRNPTSSSPLDARVQAVEREVGTMNDNIEALSTSLDEVEEKVHNFKMTMESMEEALLLSVVSKMEQFKSTVDSEIQQLKDKLELQNQTLQSTFTNADRQQIQALVQTNASLPAWQDAINGKAQEWADSAGQIGAVQSAIRSLEDRYENISTDVLHQSMVHWFTRSYPNANDLIIRSTHMQQEMSALRDFCNNSSWFINLKDQLSGLAHYAQQLVDVAGHSEYLVKNILALEGLIQHSHHLIHIAQNGANLQELPQIKKSLADTSQTAHNAMTKADEAATKASEHATRIGQLLGTVTNLEKITNSFPEYQAQQKTLSDTIHKVEALDAKVEAASAECKDLVSKAEATHAECKGLVDKFDQSVETRVSIMNSRMEELNGKTSKQLDGLKGSLSSLKESINLEQIGEFCALSPQIYLALYQIQKVLQAINTNLPGGGLDFELSFQLKDPRNDSSKKQTPTSKGKKKA